VTANVMYVGQALTGERDLDDITELGHYTLSGHRIACSRSRGMRANAEIPVLHRFFIRAGPVLTEDKVQRIRCQEPIRRFSSFRSLTPLSVPPLSVLTPLSVPNEDQMHHFVGYFFLAEHFS